MLSFEVIGPQGCLGISLGIESQTALSRYHVRSFPLPVTVLKGVLLRGQSDSFYPFVVTVIARGNDPSTMAPVPKERVSIVLNCRPETETLHP